MIRASSLKKRVGTNLIITIPLLIIILVFGAQIFPYYLIKINFLKLINDKDIYIFNNVISVLEKEIWIATIAAGVFGLLLAYAITLPIRKLTFSAKQIATGDLSRIVRIDSEDEIGALGMSFTRWFLL